MSDGLAPRYIPAQCLDGVFRDQGTYHHGYAVRHAGRSVGTITGGWGGEPWRVRVRGVTLIETADEARAVSVARAALDAAG